MDMKDGDLNKRVKEALDRTAIMALSTIGQDGSWTCPVHFSYDKNLKLTFQSMTNTKHVQNILKDPRVSVAIYSFPGPPGGNLGLQIKGTARVADGEIGSSDSKRFVITPDELWIFDSRVIRERQPVNLANVEL